MTISKFLVAIAAIGLLGCWVYSSIRPVSEVCKGDKVCISLVNTCTEKYKVCGFIIPRD